MTSIGAKARELIMKNRAFAASSNMRAWWCNVIDSLTASNVANAAAGCSERLGDALLKCTNIQSPIDQLVFVITTLPNASALTTEDARLVEQKANAMGFCNVDYLDAVLKFSLHCTC